MYFALNMYIIFKSYKQILFLVFKIRGHLI